MKQKTGQGQLNTDQIEQHLRSAVETLTPDVLSRMNFDIPQETVSAEEKDTHAAVIHLQRRLRGFALAAAACLCVVVMGGGAYSYHVRNRQVESVIGIDVNPSIELLINQKNRVLGVRALNEDAQEILAGMDLTGTDLNVAVNAVVGSMVTHGYLNDPDNAILVTVTNDSVRKAKELRASVVSDIEYTLKENQVQAVVYDQQVIEDEEMRTLAQEYGISYGKAYFLKELIDQNADLTMDDMEELSSMTMEEIAAKIAESSYELGELAGQATETAAPGTEAETTEEFTEPETTSQESAEPETETSMEETSAPPETTSAPETTKAPETEEIRDGLVEIDYVDYEDGTIYVCFVTRVKWKNPTVSVSDDMGSSYAAMVDDTSSDDCTIEVSGLEGGRSYTFVLGGLTPREGGGATTVKGYFDVPEIADGASDDEEEETGESDGDDDADDGSGDEYNTVNESRDGNTDDGIHDDGNKGGGPDGTVGNQDQPESDAPPPESEGSIPASQEESPESSEGA